jgi:monooxygenase
VPEHFDVVIVGAGMSGVGCAYYLQRELPRKRYVILEARENLGGTWDLFKYPGVRSDSDVSTFAYEFKPWPTDQVIASGPQILDYINATARENGIDHRIRTGHRVSAATWSSEDARWLLEVQRPGEESLQISCSWLFGGTGYYSYDEGYTPELPGIERFQGPVIHPQKWPENLDYADKRVVVVGSGATAVTLIPAMARDAAHITMLQRSPSYIMSIPSVDPLLSRWRERFGPRRAHRLARLKNFAIQDTIYQLCQRYPKRAAQLLRHLVARQLPDGYPVEVHFRPRYGPWDQRLCLVPDGDLFKAMRDGRASVETGTIETFTERGVRLGSGRELEADIIITATGLQLLPFGGIQITVDGRTVSPPETVAYRGVMLSGIPNFVFVIGYTTRSWTMKVGLVAGYFCRLLRYMDTHGYSRCVPELPVGTIKTRPLLEFPAGYILRSLDKLPRQGDRPPWNLPMSHLVNGRQLRLAPIADPNLHFSGTGEVLPVPEVMVSAAETVA